VDSFLKAADHFSHSFESVEIPYEGKTIPAYFYGASRSSSSPSRRPTLVVHTGFDGTQEELYSQCAVAALEDKKDSTRSSTGGTDTGIAAN
jgi:hypothetical protein